jgi:DNA-3-methyladenine glycosylase II
MSAATSVLRELKMANRKIEHHNDEGFCYDPQEAVRFLAAADPKLAPWIKHLPFEMEIRAMHNPFESLARNIIYQQLHGNAAAAIHQRVLDLFGQRGRGLKPQDILAAPEEALRGAGLSTAKTVAIKDLAAKTLDGTVPTLALLRRMEDEEIIERLTAVRGIGRWTVEMLLIFRLGRADVLPVGDLAVRKGFQVVYGLKEQPKPKELLNHGERWHPFRSVASWYLWRASEKSRDEVEGMRDESFE